MEDFRNLNDFQNYCDRVIFYDEYCRGNKRKMTALDVLPAVRVVYDDYYDNEQLLIFGIDRVVIVPYTNKERT